MMIEQQLAEIFSPKERMKEILRNFQTAGVVP